MNNKLENYIKLVGTDTSGKWMDVSKIHELIDLIAEDCCKEILNWKKEPFPFDENAAVDIIRRHIQAMKKETDIRVVRI